MHGAAQKLSDADHPYGGAVEGWASMSEGERAAYNLGYSAAHDRASKSAAEASERQELRTLRELRKVVLGIIERNPYE